MTRSFCSERRTAFADRPRSDDSTTVRSAVMTQRGWMELPTTVGSDAFECSAVDTVSPMTRHLPRQRCSELNMFRAKFSVPADTQQALDAFLRQEAAAIIQDLGSFSREHQNRVEAGRDIYDRQMPPPRPMRSTAPRRDATQHDATCSFAGTCCAGCSQSPTVICGS